MDTPASGGVRAQAAWAGVGDISIHAWAGYPGAWVAYLAYSDWLLLGGVLAAATLTSRERQHAGAVIIPLDKDIRGMQRQKSSSRSWGDYRPLWSITA